MMKYRLESYFLNNWRNFGAFFALMGMWIALSIFSDRFLKLENLLNILRQVSVICILGAGATFVILTAGIDLSCGSVLGLSGMLLALSISKIGIPMAIAFAILSGAACGFTNGLLIAKRNLPPFIATLGMMAIARGLTYALSGGRAVSDLPEPFLVLGAGYLPIVTAFVILVLGFFVLSKTTFGRYVYALGGSEAAAWLSGVAVDKTKIAVYTLAGALAGLSGLIITSRLQSAQVDAGVGYELTAIAAVVIGGTSLSGGRGSVLGTLVGALIIGTLQNGLNLLEVPTFWQQTAVGTVIIAAVLIDVSLQKGG